MPGCFDVWSTGETVDVKGRKVPVLSWSELIEMGGSLAEIQQDDLGTSGNHDIRDIP